MAASTPNGYQTVRFRAHPNKAELPSSMICSSLAATAPVQAVLFDIDGTLCDSDPLHHVAFQELLLEVGRHITIYACMRRSVTTMACR